MSESTAPSSAKLPKNIIICCDGTWNTPEEADGGKPCPTNVLKLFEAITPHDANGNPQIVHYIQGVGTRTWEKMRGGGFGYGISDNIKEGYKVICSNYEEGDRIFLFGFSRGAYTARSLAGFIHNMGIIKRVHINKVHQAYELYRDKTPDWRPGSEKAVAFQNTYGWPTKDIHFLGVWDTVGALGSPYGVVISWIIDKLFKCSFHDTKLSASIQSACHAVAIDEHRWPFRPTLWELSATHDPANFEERWFPGVHSDVGGGYPETGLADIALDWMAGKACERGLCLDLGRVSEPAFAPEPSQKMHDSQKWYYRLATLGFVKIPSALRIPLPKISQEDIARVSWCGDYQRKITPGVPTGHTVQGVRSCCQASQE